MRIAALAAMLIAVAVLCGGWGGIQLGGSVQTFVSMWTTEVGNGTSDTNDWELGVLFTIDSAVSPGGGYLHGIKFHKQPDNTGTHVAHLWTDADGLIVPGSTVTFANETAGDVGPDGWQSQLFAAPIKIDPDTNYVASYSLEVGQLREQPAGCHRDSPTRR